MLRHVALARTDVSEELSASIIRVKRIDELGTTLAVTSNRDTPQRNTNRLCILVCDTLWFIQEPHGVISQKTTFFIVTAVRTSDLILGLTVSKGPKKANIYPLHTSQIKQIGFTKHCVSFFLFLFRILYNG
jgi:hypothetical protein